MVVFRVGVLVLFVGKVVVGKLYSLNLRFVIGNECVLCVCVFFFSLSVCLSSLSSSPWPFLFLTDLKRTDETSNYRNHFENVVQNSERNTKKRFLSSSVTHNNTRSKK